MSCRVVREGVSDKRVHGLLYFLPPTGHGIRWARTSFEKIRWNPNISLKSNIFHTQAKFLYSKSKLAGPLTLRQWKDCMTRCYSQNNLTFPWHSFSSLASSSIAFAQVNLIPLIAKADSFTKEELQEFKQNVRYFIVELDNILNWFGWHKTSRSATNWQVRRSRSTTSPQADIRLKIISWLLKINIWTRRPWQLLGATQLLRMGRGRSGGESKNSHIVLSWTLSHLSLCSCPLVVFFHFMSWLLLSWL